MLSKDLARKDLQHLINKHYQSQLVRSKIKKLSNCMVQNCIKKNCPDPNIYFINICLMNTSLSQHMTFESYFSSISRIGSLKRLACPSSNSTFIWLTFSDFGQCGFQQKRKLWKYIMLWYDMPYELSFRLLHMFVPQLQAIFNHWFD